MNRRRFITVISLLVLVALGTPPLQGQEAAGNGKIVAIYHAKNTPAVELGEALAAFLDDESDATTGKEPVIVSESTYANPPPG